MLGWLEYTSPFCCDFLKRLEEMDISTAKTEIPWWNKYTLSIQEAAEYFGIGQHRLREIVSEDYENKYHLMLGRTIKIKREQFEEFIKQVGQV